MTAAQGAFAMRVAEVLATRVVQFVIGIATAFLLARLLGPSGRGAYHLAILTPATLFALGQLGLTSAVRFFAGRGRPGRPLLDLSLGVGALVSAALVALTLLSLPILETTVLRAAPKGLLRIALVALPFQFVASLGGTLLIGRRSMREYNLILIGQSLAMLAATLILVGVAGLGAAGAVAGSVAVAAATALAITMAARRATRGGEQGGQRGGPPVGLGELVGHGARLYPAAVTTFLSYRVDVFLLSALLGASSASAIGLYSLAVRLAELVFVIPDSIGMVFFPRVAGAERAHADRMAPLVSRATVLVSALGALALAPAAVAGVYLVLPAFVPSLPAFFVLLPGIVAFSLAKVLSSYVSGLGMTRPVTVAAVASLALNVAANLLLIPIWGLVGAAAASLLSYTLHAVLLSIAAARLSRLPVAAFVLPTGGEVRQLRLGLVQLIRREGTAEDAAPPDDGGGTTS